MIEKKSFVRYKLSDDQNVFTIRLNDEEKELLFKDRVYLKQAKQSTALKQLWKIGRIVLQEPIIAEIISIISGNFSRNERLGIVDVEAEIPKYQANVTQKNNDV